MIMMASYAKRTHMHTHNNANNAQQRKQQHTRWTHIDDMCMSVRVVSPAGVTETRKLPASGAGPAEHRTYIGSEVSYSPDLT